MQISRVKTLLLEPSRIDPEYYRKEYLLTEQSVRDFGAEKLSSVGKFFAGPFGSKLPSNLYLDSGIPLFRVGNVGSLEVLTHGMAYLAPHVHKELATSAVKPGDLLVVKASVSEKICKVPDSIPEANITQHIIAIRPNGSVDSDCLCAFLFSRYGREQLLRRSLGSIIQYLGIVDAKTVLFPRIQPDCQRYIGDKVRVAESLRRFANSYKEAINALITTPGLLASLETNDSITNRISTREFSPSRLDPKYYRKHASEVLRACKAESTKAIRDLRPEVNNGFEERNFCDRGINYVTVAEVSTGRLDVRKSPRISGSTQIPAKATLSSECVLVVRSGSIGTAVKVHKDDTHAVISSHLIRLRFNDERTASIVAAFLNSPYGKCLMWKISYGAVQSQIGQDELLQIPIPDHCFSVGDEILNSIRRFECATRFSESLVSGASLIIEGLLDGTIQQQELVDAQAQLETGNKTTERTILSRLYEGGIDATDTRPLFPDMDAYYELLQIADQALVDGVNE
jgi:type I restriction enzyme S subunit